MGGSEIVVVMKESVPYKRSKVPETQVFLTPGGGGKMRPAPESAFVRVPIKKKTRAWGKGG